MYICMYCRYIIVCYWYCVCNNCNLCKICVVVRILCVSLKKLWFDCIRYLAYSTHFWYVFGCELGMSPHFYGENRVIFGITYHFWNFKVYSRNEYHRTLYRGSIYRSAIYNAKLEYPKCQVFLLDILHSSIVSSVFTWQDIL